MYQSQLEGHTPECANGCVTKYKTSTVVRAPVDLHTSALSTHIKDSVRKVQTYIQCTLGISLIYLNQLIIETGNTILDLTNAQP